MSNPLKALPRLLWHRAVPLGVPSDTLGHRKSTQSYEHSLGQNLYPAPLGRILLSEVGSFFGRIRALLDTKLYRRGVACYPGTQMPLSRQERKRLQDACTQDMQSLFADRPWLTLVDSEIFVLGWKRGAELVLRNSGTESLSSKQLSCENLNEPGVIPEPSKRDL